MSESERALQVVEALTYVLRMAQLRRDEAIRAAVVVGCSERAIGRAAGMSGVAVHYRKAKA